MFTARLKAAILSPIAMHDFKKNSGRNPRQALDGFLSSSARSEMGSQTAKRQSLHLDGLKTSGRRVDDFRRPEGYHTTLPQTAQLGGKEKTKGKVDSSASLLHMTLPGGEIDAKAKKNRKRKKTKTPVGTWYAIRKWGVRTAMVLGVLILIVGGFLGIKAFTKIHKVLKGGGKAVALQANVKPELLKGEGDGRINVLLLGKGGDGHDGPDLTDTLLVASIDPVNKTADLVSIPRDLWVTVPTYGSMKINAVYANAKYRSLNTAPKDAQKAQNAGIAAAKQTVTDVLGIPIHYYGLIDFHAFQQAVDTVGGVDFNVPQSAAVTDYMYNEDTHKPYVLSVGAGQQHFDGLRALMYVRTRHTSLRGDFDRTERQRLFIQALSSKILTAGTYTNPLKISELMSAFGDHISTDFSINDALRMMQISKNIPGNGITSVGLADPPNNFVMTDAAGSASVVRPTAGFNDYSQIQNYIRNTLRDPYLAKENGAVAVLNGTNTAGLATSKSDQLKSYGYNVVNVADAPAHTYTKTVLVDFTAGKKPYTKNYLEKRFGVKATTRLPDNTIQATGDDFVIILGQDATTSSQN